MSSALTARIAEDYAAGTRSGAAADESARRAALAALLRDDLPGNRDENWRYASLRGLERLRFAPVPAAPLSASAALPAPIPGFERHVFIDGRHAPELSAAGSAAFSIPAAPREAHGRSTDQRFALLNDAFAPEGADLRVRGQAQLELIFLAQAGTEAGASYPRTAVHVAAGSHLELIERHLSAGAAGSFVTSLSEIKLERDAQLTHYRVQELSRDSTLFDTLLARLDAGASYHVHGISTGARAARATQQIELAGAGAALSMAQASLGDGAQVLDGFAQVQHRAPHTRTEQLFRGIAAGRARVAFNGKIVVAAGAAGTDSQQSLRGLLAGAGAEIDVRPQLEIYTDDVRCSHGATTGKLDENMLFYLLSRGLEPDTAQRLLKWAFLADAFARIGIPELRHQIEASLAAGLKDGALKELL
jgi:Fe-S cluster assembly protein SufD